jgi:sugar/nucleoside kinase (ribokinase family)
LTKHHHPDYLIIGNVTKDNTPDGPILGGTSSYSALTAHKLGQEVAMITSIGPDIPSFALLNGIQIKTLPHDYSTTFENIYINGERHQKWLANSGPISLSDIPSAWRQASIVHMAPIGQEMSPAMCADFPNSLVGVGMQGWLRGRDSQMNVIYEPHPELEAWLPQADVLVLSLNDLFGNEDELMRLVDLVALVVETLGPQGCKIYHQDEVIHVPVEPQPEVDPTGSGDIFSTAFFIKYHQTGDFIKAAQFANACASLSVSKVGLAGVPKLPQVEAQMARLYGSD